MSYVTSVERMSRAEGLEQGHQQGLEQGKRQAVRQVARAWLGAVPEALEQQVAATDAAELDALLDRVARAASVDEL